RELLLPRLPQRREPHLPVVSFKTHRTPRSRALTSASSVEPRGNARTRRSASLTPSPARNPPAVAALAAAVRSFPDIHPRSVLRLVPSLPRHTNAASLRSTCTDR